MKNLRWIQSAAACFLALILGAEQVSAAVTLGGEGTVYPEKEHAEVSLGEMSRELFDQEAFDQAVEELDELSGRKGQEDQVLEQYQIILEETDRLYTQYVLLTLDYYRDVENEEIAEKYEESEKLLMEAGNTAAETLSALLDSRYYGQLLTETMGEENAGAFMAYDGITMRESILTQREMDLIREYEEALVQDYDSPREENQVLGEIYLELVEVRTDLAETQGYDNYADYAYEQGYYRDYTVEDVEALRQQVKEHLVPLYEACLDCALENNVDAIYTGRQEDSGEMLERLIVPMEKIYPEVGTAYKYFLSQELYDIEPDEKKIDMGYTVELPFYGDAYIYDSGSGTYEDYFTMIHEFGHFTSVFYEDNHYLYSVVNMDVSEIHSQGLEVLFWPYFEEIVPGMGRTMQIYTVYEMLTNIVFCCIYDEIEQEIYRNPDMTLEELNRTVEEISSGYGEIPPLDRYEWVEMTHLYQQPFYVISYATSALAALELLEMAQENRDQALDAYMEISASGTGTAYCQVLENTGLRNIFQEGAVKETAEAMAGLLDLELPEPEISQTPAPEQEPQEKILESVLGGMSQWLSELTENRRQMLWDAL